MDSFLPTCLRVLGRALVVGLVIVGASGLLAALYLAPGWGLLLLVAATTTGLSWLAARHLVLRRRIRLAAACGAAQAETWLRTLRGHAGGTG